MAWATLMLKQNVAIKEEVGEVVCLYRMSQFCKLSTLDFMTISPKVLYTGNTGGLNSESASRLMR